MSYLANEEFIHATKNVRNYIIQLEIILVGHPPYREDWLTKAPSDFLVFKTNKVFDITTP